MHMHKDLMRFQVRFVLCSLWFDTAFPAEQPYELQCVVAFKIFTLNGAIFIDFSDAYSSSVGSFMF